MHLYLCLALASVVAGHGYVVRFEVDGTIYPAYIPAVDLEYGPTKNIQWQFPDQGIVIDGAPYLRGAAPVIDVSSPDIACRKNPILPQLTAKARAGSDISFHWSTYPMDHKGPLMTYMGLMKTPDSKPQDVEFFKIDQSVYEPGNRTWGLDTLIKNNHTWTSRIPSDILPGRYVVRHEILSLHFGAGRNYVANGQEVTKTGSQFYPVCINVDVSGSGKSRPPGVKFPGAYNLDDAGIKVNSYYGVEKYIPPGPPVYQGKHEAPQGIQPVATETGADPRRNELITKVETLLRQSFGRINKHLESKGLLENDKLKTGGNPVL